jgi:hypothetical protein
MGRKGKLVKVYEHRMGGEGYWTTTPPRKFSAAAKARAKKSIAARRAKKMADYKAGLRYGKRKMVRRNSRRLSAYDRGWGDGFDDAFKLMRKKARKNSRRRGARVLPRKVRKMSKKKSSWVQVSPTAWVRRRKPKKSKARRNAGYRARYGHREACKTCGMDIEFQGKKLGWIGRGGDRFCDQSGASKYDRYGEYRKLPHKLHKPGRA